MRVGREQIWELLRVTKADAANSISYISLTHQSSPATVWNSRYPQCPNVLVLQWYNSEVHSTGFLRRSQNITPQLPIAVTSSIPLLLQTVYLKMGRLEHLPTLLYLVLNCPWGHEIPAPTVCTSLSCKGPAECRRTEMQENYAAGVRWGTGEIRGGPRVWLSHQSHLLHMLASSPLPVTTSKLSPCFTSQCNLSTGIALITKHICWWECKLV